ncbi:hypothetical protein WI36_20140 [Burkholderia ubonensis]|nr:hypothetical protein WI36_20140 [Burkholderia ubonensis]
MVRKLIANLTHQLQRVLKFAINQSEPMRDSDLCRECTKRSIRIEKAIFTAGARQQNRLQERLEFRVNLCDC